MAGGGGFTGGVPWQQPQQPAAPPASLLQMLDGGAPQGGGDPYGGKTLAQIVLGGLPFNMNVGADGRPMGGGVGGGFDMGDGGGFDANAWLDRPATNENVSEAIQRGGQYRPEVAKTLQSSGAEGGFFSIPSEASTQIPWGYYPSTPDDNAAPAEGRAGGGPARQPNRGGDNPAPGMFGMSTNNWRLLPYQFRDPNYAMRAGHIIDRSRASNLGGYLGYTPMGDTAIRQTHILGSGGHGYPLSYGYPFGPRASFFPGQIEPWTPETPSSMGAGIT